MSGHPAGNSRSRHRRVALPPAPLSVVDSRERRAAAPAIATRAHRATVASRRAAQAARRLSRRPALAALSHEPRLRVASRDLAALAALLNSGWLTALARLVADPARGGFRRFNARVVRGLPVPPAGSGAWAALARHGMSCEPADDLVADA